MSSYQAANLQARRRDPRGAGAVPPRARGRALRRIGRDADLVEDGGRPGQPTLQYEILGSAYGGGNGNDGASAVATHLSNLHITPIEILGNRISLSHRRIRPGGGFRRRRRIPRRARVPARSTKCCRTPVWCAATTRRNFRRTASPAASPAAAAVSSSVSAPRTSSETPASGRYECAPASASCCKARAVAATAIRKSATRAALARDIAEGYVSAARPARLRQQGVIVMADQQGTGRHRRRGTHGASPCSST